MGFCPNTQFLHSAESFCTFGKSSCTGPPEFMPFLSHVSSVVACLSRKVIAHSAQFFHSFCTALKIRAVFVSCFVCCGLFERESFCTFCTVFARCELFCTCMIGKGLICWTFVFLLPLAFCVGFNF